MRQVATRSFANVYGGAMTGRPRSRCPLAGITDRGCRACRASSRSAARRFASLRGFA